MIQTAFYKGKGKILDKLIRWWTRSKYSHVELVIYGNSFSSSGRDKGVREKFIDYEKDKWDIYEIKKPINDKEIYSFFNKTKDKKYDFLGILFSQIFNRNKHNKNKYFCSEWLLEALDKQLNITHLKDYHNYSPGKLYKYLKIKGVI